MPGRDRHQKKDVEKALQYAEDEGGFTVRPIHSGHVWGAIHCPADVCVLRVHSTPRNEGNEAKRIRRFVDRCDHKEKEG
ncbi:MAG: hypothetical protein ACRDZ7_20475 [Acidimicrobiia bacterium]